MSVLPVGALALLTTVTALPPFADEVDELARQLISVRSEVEELNQEVDLLKDEHRAEMGSLAAQKK